VQAIEDHTKAVQSSSRLPLSMNPIRWLREQKLSRRFWIFFAVAFLFDFGFAVYFFLFNLYLLDLHCNERTIGLVGGALTLGSVAGTLPAGWLARKAGLRPLLFVCIISAVLLGVARALVIGDTAHIAFGFLAGLAMCMWGVCFLPTIAMLTTGENRAAAFSLIFSVSIGSSALGGLVCGYLPQWLAMARHPMAPADLKRLILIASCGIAFAALAPLFLLRLPEPTGESQPPTQPTPRKLPSFLKLHPFLWRFLPAMALWTATLAAFNPFANVYLSRNLHISLAQIGVIFSVSQGIQLCAGLLTPLLFRKLGLLNGIVASQVATAAAIGLLAATGNRSIAVVLYLSFSATQWMSSPGLYNLLMSKVPEAERSSASAMTLFSNALLGSAATAGAGILFAQFGYPPVLAGIAALALVAAILFWTVVAPAGRDSPPASAEPLAI
jgi:MFS family permease